eukprot:TRINITY_DN20060_c0_g1_i1.p1 TRINITY_DN20060_c0_g1~~TRINITY_DN20060_c0_g1_i1.p1  ORF type:complete len:593 (-),score=19.10 TRINITY_DN20060_c0_g1_i1:77-1855(-)
MISAKDLYDVLVAVVPLYVAMILAYGSVKWWKIFTPEQCSGINRFVAVFAVPLLSFHFISRNNPYTMNFRFIAADTLQKIIMLFVLGAWTTLTRGGSLEWMITIFSLSTLPNTLVMGIPLLDAMYGLDSGSLMVQIVVMQCIVWYTLLLFLFEYRGAKMLITEQFPDTAASIVSFKVDSDVVSLDGRDLEAQADVGEDGKLHVTVRKSTSSVISSKRSQGLGSLPSLTPRPSNLTGAEIYSLNPTPRGSNFNHSDYYSVNRGLMSPRQSNFGHSDAYSLQSSRGPTPRPSNFEDENTRSVMMNSPKFIYPYKATNVAAETAHHNHHYPAPNPDIVSAHPNQNSHSASSGSAAAAATRPLSMKRPVVGGGGADSISKSPQGRGGGHHDAKELHMFVWSSSASPVSEGGLHVFGGADFSENVPVNASSNTAKEIRMLVSPTPPSAPDHAANGGTKGFGEPLVPRSEGHAYQEDFGREDFSFNNTNEKLERERDGPTLSKFGSSSTAELHPKIQDEKQRQMPPTSVMTRLILIMVWRKLIRNPNTYSSLIGLVWALVSYRWHVSMPRIVNESIKILSDAGLGMAMFSLGMYLTVF